LSRCAVAAAAAADVGGRRALAAGVRIATLRLYAALFGGGGVELPARISLEGELRDRLPRARLQQYRLGEGRPQLGRQPEPVERAIAVVPGGDQRPRAAQRRDV